MLGFYCSSELLSCLLELLLLKQRIAVLVLNFYVDWQLVRQRLLSALLVYLSLRHATIHCIVHHALFAHSTSVKWVLVIWSIRTISFSLLLTWS